MTKNGFTWKRNWNKTIRFKIHQFWLIYHLLQAPLWIHCMTDHSLHCYNCQQYSIWIENMLNRQSFLFPNHTFDCSHFLPFGSMLLKLTKMNTNDITKAIWWIMNMINLSIMTVSVMAYSEEGAFSPCPHFSAWLLAECCWCKEFLLVISYMAISYIAISYIAISCIA